MADKKLLKSGPMALHIMGQCHVGTRDWAAVLHMFGRLKKGAVDTMPARHLYYIAGQAMAQHRINQKEYNAVMNGGKW
jgi:hypothetical protein